MLTKSLNHSKSVFRELLCCINWLQLCQLYLSFYCSVVYIKDKLKYVIVTKCNSKRVYLSKFEYVQFKPIFKV